MRPTLGRRCPRGQLRHENTQPWPFETWAELAAGRGCDGSVEGGSEPHTCFSGVRTVTPPDEGSELTVSKFLY